MVAYVYQVQFSSVTQLCPTLYDPMDCSVPGFPVHHHLPKLAQTHLHWVSYAIQPSNLLSSLSHPDLNLSHHQGLFKWVNSYQMAKYWNFSLSVSPSNEYSGLILFRIDWFLSPCSPRDSQESSPAPQFNSIDYSALSFLYSPTLTSIHDYWKKP